MAYRLTEDYFNFCIDRAEANGQFYILLEMKKLVDKGMSMENAYSYCSEKVCEKIEHLRPIESFYEEKYS